MDRKSISTDRVPFKNMVRRALSRKTQKHRSTRLHLLERDHLPDKDFY